MADDSIYNNQDDTTATTTNFPHPRQTLLNLTNDASPRISPLEQEVLDEYSRLLSNLNQVRTHAVPQHPHD